jgi:hypothetical protein
MQPRSALLLAFALVLGCGSSDNQGGGGSLDCAWLTGDNCWKSTTSAAQSCLPASDAQGTFSADNATCTYATGHVVTFTPPLTLPLPDDPTWNFTVAASGQTCLHYEQKANGDLSLTVGNQTFTEGASGAMGVRFTCPDGTSYVNANAFDLFSCPEGLNGMPGCGWSSSDSSVSFSLIGTSGSSGMPIFDCTKP